MQVNLVGTSGFGPFDVEAGATHPASGIKPEVARSRKPEFDVLFLIVS